jgi:hypothetical protein
MAQNIEFLKSTCRPKKAHLQAQTRPPPAKPAQPTRPPEPINGQLTDRLSVTLFSTDGQRFSPKPEPPDPNPPLVLTTLLLLFLRLSQLDPPSP